jgi:hypothetical protein
VAAVSELDELYVMARRVLLDALHALGTHRDAVVLVGAQAVYLRVGAGDLALRRSRQTVTLRLIPRCSMNSTT